MFAQCPTCHAVYQVSAADLNVTRGRLHCEFCDTTFDALGSLTDHPVAHTPAESAEPAHEAPAPAADFEQAGNPDPAGDAELPIRTDGEPALPVHGLHTGTAPQLAPEVRVEDFGAPHESATEQPAAGAITSTAETEVSGEPASLSHDIEASEATPTTTPDEMGATARAVPQPDLDPPAMGESTQCAVPPSAVVTAGTGGDTPPHAGAHQAHPETALAPEALDPESLLGIRRSPWVRAAWGTAAVVMLLLLAAQILHRSRAELVMRPSIAPWMHRIYGALGMRLDPNWDVEGYRIVRRAQMSAITSADGATRLQLVATMTNDAARPQPYPLLRLTLEDRWGSAVAARDFTPREYLRESDRAANLLAPGEQADVELFVVDPGVDAAGFRLDMCLTDVDGVTRCADDS
jgi:predicted Zn finger-like uncharacterized protein